MWITLLVAWLLILHFGKIWLRRWAWKNMFSNGQAVRAVEESDEK